MSCGYNSSWVGECRNYLISTWSFSYTRSSDWPGRTQQTGIFCGKSFIAYIFRSQRARAREQEREWRNPVPFKENYPPPRTCRSLIGCSPSAELSSWGRQSTWSGELPLAHAQIICLPLRTQDVSAILQWRMWGQLLTYPPFLLFKSNRPPILMRVEIEVKSPVCR